MTLRTEVPFTLPRGYVDGGGALHRRGVMRLATARDEIEPLADDRVAANQAYLTVLVLARVIVELGDLPRVGPEVVEQLFAADLAYLQRLYAEINYGDGAALAVVDSGTRRRPAAASPARVRKAARA